MRKSLLALAVLGTFAGAASAQSSVTLYGRLDVGYQWNEFASQSGTVSRGQVIPNTNGAVCNAGTTASPGTCPVYSQENTSAINGGYVAGNRWGLRGSEALGDGMSAIFTLESGFDIDTGLSGQGNRLFGRQAWAGLATPFGNIVGGRIATFSSGTGSFDMFSAVDPFATGWGINTLGSTFISANGLRLDNAFAYVSPTWAGIKFGAAYSFNVNGQESAPSDKNTSALALGASWSWGPLYAAITYDIAAPASVTATGTSITSVPDDQKHLQIGASWDFKFLKIYGAWADQQNITTLPGADQTFINLQNGAGNYNNNAWMLGASVPIGKFTIRGSYQYADADNIINRVNNQNVSFEPDYGVLGIGADYRLSNRTLLYVGYGDRSAKGTLTSTLFDRSQFAAGVNHSF